MVQDLLLKNILKSPIKNKHIKHKNFNYNFISLCGDFYLDPNSFLPICSDSLCTSTRLFGFFERVKYDYIFSKEFEEKISGNEGIEIIENAFVVGSSGNYYHDVVDCFSRIFSYNKNFYLHKNLDKIIISDTNSKSIFKEILNLSKY